MGSMNPRMSQEAWRKKETEIARPLRGAIPDGDPGFGLVLPENHQPGLLM